ncbi:unnamed protein product [Blepharisma stoltei]|uniref:Transmembrane protein n=1 Tax=Blepharisma stoltei TaxID=1481888 RepID=A0AAU9K005_9CILI|nr:unnamed protein product [Blepharisma stoltei]
MDPKELPLIRPRQKRSTSSPCIKWRHQIERHPKATLFWQIFIGIFAFLHFLVSFGILTILPGHRKYELSLVPLICLSVEISVLCNTMLGVVIYLLVKRKKGMATWHRSVIGILIRNIFISAAFVITLILSIFYIETTRKSILIHSVSTISAPLIILCIISILKIVFLETSYTWYWLSLNILGLSEIFILIMKEDYDYRISWCVSLTPIWLFFIIHLAFSFTLFTVKSRNIAKLLLVFSMIGSICGSSSIAFLAVFLDGHDNSWDKFMMFGWAALFWFTFAYAYSFGKWAIGTLFCHIEFEFIQSKKRLNLRAKTWEVLL